MKSPLRRTPDPRNHIAQQGALNSGLVLLLDSSDNPSNAPEYALKLADAHNWHVNLFHVIDLDQFPESGNPVTMGRLLRAEHRRCAGRLETYKEMIECAGIRVSIAEPLVVSLFQLEELLESIRQLQPDVVVVGRGAFSKSLLNSVVRQTPFPVLIVPDTQPVQVPGSLLLYSDGRRLRESALHQVLDFAARTRQQISVLSVEKRKKPGIRKLQSYLASPTTTSMVDFYRQEGVDSVLTIERFVRKRSFGMLSVILRDHWWFRRLFYRWSFMDLAYGVDVPLLIFKAKNS